MSQAVKLSSELVLEARLTAKLAERSIAGQIEFWAQLGKSLEPLLRGDRVMALRRAGEARPLSEAIASVDSATGRERSSSYLKTRPFPHFEACDDDPSLVVRIDEDGTRTRGRFVNRLFEVVAAEQP